MISVLRLHLHILRIPRRARLQVVGRFLIRSVQRSSYFPTQAAALTGFVLRELAGYFVEFGAVVKFGQGFFFFGVFLALNCLLAFLAHADVESREEDVPRCDVY